MAALRRYRQPVAHGGITGHLAGATLPYHRPAPGAGAIEGAASLPLVLTVASDGDVTTPGGSVAFKSAGTAHSTATSGVAPAPTYPVTVDAGDLAMLQIAWRRGSTNSFGDWHAPDEAGWTLIATDDADPGAAPSWQWIYARMCDGDEDGATVPFPAGPLNTEVRVARVYTFSGAAGADTGDFESSAFTQGSDASIELPSVTLSADGGMAAAFVFVTDDNALGSATGETGGDWVEAVAEFVTGDGLDMAIQLQVAEMAAAGTITGGAFTMGASDVWQVRALGIKAAA